MKKTRILSMIAYALGCVLGLLVFWAFINLADQVKENTAQNAELKTRITNLEQDQKNIKEVLDAHGFEDLNL